MSNQKGFFSRYKRLLIGSIVVYVLLTLGLFLLGGGPQGTPFIYQIF